MNLKSGLMLAVVAMLCGCNNSTYKGGANANPATPPPVIATLGHPSASDPVGNAVLARAEEGAQNLPADCNLYISEVNACVVKMGPTNPLAAQFKQQIDGSRMAWGLQTDKAKLAPQCKQMASLFAQSKHALGC